jgi:UDP-glucose 4-epimerase
MVKKILITGNAGLLGSNLADFILNNYPKEYLVYGIDDLSGGYLENIDSRVNFYKTNILSNEFNDIFEHIKPDYVFHLAAYAAEGLSSFIRQFNYSNNLLATSKIVNCCIKYNTKRLVFTSSMAIYGNNIAPFDEAMTPAPIDPYGVAKYACEQDIQIAGIQHGLDWCIIRPHNVYGEKQNIWDKYRNVLGIWMNQAIQNNPITIFGDGTQKRAFSYIDDILGCLLNSATLSSASKQIINLGGAKEYTINEACNTLLEIIGPQKRLYLEPRYEVKYAYATYKKSVDILGFEHITSLYDGLQNMWLWAIKQPKRPQFIWTEYEIDNGIYSFWKK